MCGGRRPVWRERSRLDVVRVGVVRGRGVPRGVPRGVVRRWHRRVVAVVAVVAALVGLLVVVAVFEVAVECRRGSGGLRLPLAHLQRAEAEHSRISLCDTRYSIRWVPIARGFRNAVKEWVAIGKRACRRELQGTIYGTCEDGNADKVGIR
jgi:hypothetical protein